MYPLTTLVFVATVEVAFGCSCYDSRSLHQKLRDAHFVLAGTVVSLEKEKELSTFGFVSDRIAYTLQNHHIYKVSQTSSEFQKMKENGVGRVYAHSEPSMCGVRLANGTSYLLAGQVGADGRGEVSSCGSVYIKLD